MALARDLLNGNRLLASAPEPVRDRIAAIGSHERLDFKQTIFEPDERITQIVFPRFGVCSLLSVGADERAVEVATVGNEGFVGLPVFLQATLMSAHRAIVQIAGDAVVIDAADFLEIGNSGGPFQVILMRYTHALMTQISQAAACNRLHSIEQRCARWLLMTHDRVEGDEFELTQEFVSQMLGTGRQAVNEAEQALQDRGLISYTRGRVRVVDRHGLEAAACDCYRIIQAEFDRVVPPVA